MKCYVCGDDWTGFDTDMSTDERLIFMKGNGCPSCISFRKNPYDDNYFQENPLDEESEEESEENPDWVCDGCDVSIFLDDKDDLQWDGGRAIHSKAGIVYPYSNFPDRRNPRREDMAHTHCPACYKKFND